MKTQYPTSGTNQSGTNQSGIKIAANNNEHARHHVALGVDVGSPDLLLTYRRDDITYMLYLELKTKVGKLSKPQIAWNEDFDAHHESSNCKRAVAYGFAEARRTIGDFYQAV